LGQPDKARTEAAVVLRIDPSYTISWSPLAATFKRPEDTEHLWNGLRQAGLPER
jgi:Tfp pilus assembly protein PilF